MTSRDPKPKQGVELRATLLAIADGCDDLDVLAVERYTAAGVLGHAEVARLARSGDPGDRQTARLRAAAMLAALDAKAST